MLLRRKCAMPLGHANPTVSMDSMSTVGHVGPTYILRVPVRSGRIVGRGHITDGRGRILLRRIVHVH
jgi:hypothetical protein